MGVFDPRQGQVLIQPVTNFYKGKAIRQELAMNELRKDKLEFEVNTQEERLQMDRDEAKRADKRLGIAERNAKLAEDQFLAEVGEAQARAYGEDLAARLYAIEASGIGGEEAMMAKAYQELSEYAASLPAKHGAKVNKILADGKVTPYELEMMKGGLIASDIVGKDFFGEDGVPKDHDLFAKINPDGTVDWNTVVAARPDSKKAEDAVNRGLFPVSLSAQGPNAKGEIEDFEKGLKDAQALVETGPFDRTFKASIDSLLGDLKTKGLFWDSNVEWNDFQSDHPAIYDQIKLQTALYMVNNPGADIRLQTKRMFDYFVEIEDGEIKPREIPSFSDEDGTYQKMPNGQWYNISSRTKK